MDKKELIQKCLIEEDAIVTYPFKDKKYDNTPILRHKFNNKWFGVIFEQEGNLYINLKAKPEMIWILKDQYPNSVFSAWHMNKNHWYKVLVNNIDQASLDKMIKISFDITDTKRRTKKSI